MGQGWPPAQVSFAEESNELKKFMRYLSFSLISDFFNKATRSIPQRCSCRGRGEFYRHAGILTEHLLFARYLVGARDTAEQVPALMELTVSGEGTQ